MLYRSCEADILVLFVSCQTLRRCYGLREAVEGSDTGGSLTTVIFGCNGRLCTLRAGSLRSGHGTSQVAGSGVVDAVRGDRRDGGAVTLSCEA